MDSVDKLLELYRLVQDLVIKNKFCKHKDFSNPKKWCEVCFIINLIYHGSERESDFVDETTEEQRRCLDEMWQKYSELNDSEPSED